MIVAISGSSGLIGSKLVAELSDAGHSVRRLVRKATGMAGDVLWDPLGAVDTRGLEGVQAVIHLAGETIGQRWNAETKARIYDSRARGTRTLSEALASMQPLPEVLVCASAIGYYGDRGSEELNEESGPGKGFLAEVCVAWERATEPAARRGIRVVNMRTGIALDTHGGALARMLLPFRLCAGGRMGSGKQYWSWIAMDDVIGAFREAITNKGLQGGVNATAPNPLTNAEFTKILAHVLKRPAIFPMPAFAARIALTEMADALLFSSARVLPTRLTACGYQFRFPDLEGALRHIL